MACLLSRVSRERGEGIMLASDSQVRAAIDLIFGFMESMYILPGLNLKKIALIIVGTWIVSDIMAWMRSRAE
jgi:hypothetical protein